MNSKKAKAIRRVLRRELETSGRRFIARPQPFGMGIRYVFQYISTNGRRMYGVAKRLYNKHGLLPR